MSAIAGEPHVEGAPEDHEAPICYRPGHGYMVLRENRTTGDRFFGCRCYPDCRVTRSYRDWQRAYDMEPEECWL